MRNGEPVARFREMVGGGRPISPRRARDPWLHRRRPRERAGVRRGVAQVPRVRRAPTCWWRTTASASTFPCFGGSPPPLGGADDLIFFDTYPLARSLLDESARLEDLAHRFEVPLARAHHALDDAEALAHVLGRLEALKAGAGAQGGAGPDARVISGLALALDQGTGPTPKSGCCASLAVPHALGRYSDCLEFYAAELEAGAPGRAPGGRGDRAARRTARDGSIATRNARPRSATPTRWRGSARW